MKAKRFIYEYANSKRRIYEQLIKDYPHQRGDYERMINAVNRAVWSNEHGYITDDETLRLIMDSAQATY